MLLLEKDDSESDWYVAIRANGQEFHIEYQLPEEKSPWRHATVKGATTTLKKFRDYIIIAMTESDGWTDCKELEELYDKMKIEKS